FGGKIPKQFIKINGQEMLSYSVNTFLGHPQIDEVIIVSHLEWIKIVSENYSDCRVVEGGKRRQDSSLKGIRATSENTENVLIHDAARPFISPIIISDCLKALIKCKGTAPIMNTSNSLIQLDNARASYVDRSKIYEVQTPQCFKKDLILNVFESNIEGTDEIGMVLRKIPEIQLEFVKGSLNNSKITTDSDIKYFTK
ncbi:uncharacterized protein METZ01_LOCUS416414, partial [marine metagenome]